MHSRGPLVDVVFQEPRLIIENVTGIEYVVNSLQSDLYYVEYSVLNSLDMGWPINRERGFFHAHHRLKTGKVPSPLSRFQMRFHRSMSGSWRNFFWLHLVHPSCPDLVMVDDEMRVELAWARRRPTSIHKSAKRAKRAKGPAALQLRDKDFGPDV